MNRQSLAFQFPNYFHLEGGTIPDRWFDCSILWCHPVNLFQDETIYLVFGVWFLVFRPCRVESVFGGRMGVILGKIWHRSGGRSAAMAQPSRSKVPLAETPGRFRSV